jgi:hypothetical protein
MVNPLQQLGPLRYGLLCVAVLAQAATILITWQVWLVRVDYTNHPNLPVFDVPQINFGTLVLLSIVLVLASPRWGLWTHLAVLVIASLFDQWRLQPQLLSIWILMLAVIFPIGPQVGRIFLTSLWCWAGLHKLLSPDWWTHRSWGLTTHLGWDQESMYFWFAAVVAASELLLGVMAWLKPRWAAFGCPLLHVGIVIFLSPLFHNWNFSVIPWNLATALIGSWLLWKVGRVSDMDSNSNPAHRDRACHYEGASFSKKKDLSREPQPNDERRISPRMRRFPLPANWEIAAMTVLLILPASFYFGWLDHSYAHVLYSDHLPRGVVTRLDGQPHEIDGWGKFNVPFPYEQRLLKQHFLLTSAAGEKLHLHEPRAALEEQFYMKTADGIRQLSESEFFAGRKSEPIGVTADARVTVFRLIEAKVRMVKRSENGMIYAVEISPEVYSSEILALAATLRNLEEIQLAGTRVTDDDLECLLDLTCLRDIGVSDTAISAAGVSKLESMPSMKNVIWDGPFGHSIAD